MSSTGAGYDYSCTTYSPDGRIFQVEYAGKAAEKSGTVIGVRCVDGFVLGVEKPLPMRMMLRSSNRRICTVDEHAGMAIAGLLADARQLVNRAREEADNYHDTYGSHIPGKILSARVAGFVHAHTLYWYLRPFGCSVLLGTFDEPSGAELYMVEPSGQCSRYFATAVGKGTRAAKTELEKMDFSKVTCREAAKEVARIITKLHDDVKEKEYELEMSWCCRESGGKHVMLPPALKEELETAARDAKKREEMADSDDESDG